MKDWKMHFNKYSEDHRLLSSVFKLAHLNYLIAFSDKGLMNFLKNLREINTPAILCINGSGDYVRILKEDTLRFSIMGFEYQADVCFEELIEVIEEHLINYMLGG